MPTHTSTPNQFATLSPLLPHPSEVASPSSMGLYSGLFHSNSLGINCEFANPLSSASSIYFIPTDHPIPEFLHQLTKMLSDEKNSKMISWINKKVVVHDPTGLTRNVFHKYFRHSNYASFQRQLNYFGFRKVSGKKGKMHPCSYVHDLVTNDIRSLLSIKRKNSSKAVQGAAKAKDKKLKGELAQTNSSGRKKKDCEGTAAGKLSINNDRPNKKIKLEDKKELPSVNEANVIPSDVVTNACLSNEQVPSACDLPRIDVSKIASHQVQEQDQVIPQENIKDNAFHSASKANKIIKKICNDNEPIVYSTVSFQDVTQAPSRTPTSQEEIFYFPRDDRNALGKSNTKVISCEDIMDPKSYESFRYPDPTLSNANISWNVPKMDPPGNGNVTFQNSNFGFVDLEKDLSQLGTYFVPQNNTQTDTAPSFSNCVFNASIPDRRNNSCNPSSSFIDSSRALVRPDTTLSMSAPAFSGFDGLSSTKSFLSFLKDDCDSVRSLKSLCGISVTFGATNQVEPTPLNRMNMNAAVPLNYV